MSTLTIITITYNAGQVLERTLRSIEEQVFKNFEYLLIDGKSTDDTLIIAEKFGHLFTKIISEPDKGLYDAMNKGLKFASGKYVWFMNAGDEIATPTVCQELHEMLQNEPDVIYGETIFTDIQGNSLGYRSELTPHKLPDILIWQQMKYGMLVCHQSFIARKKIAPNFLLNNLSADIDWQIKILKQSQRIVRYRGVISKYLVGGISNQQLRKSLTDRFKVIQYHFGFLSSIKAHLYILGRGLEKVVKKGGKYW